MAKFHELHFLVFSTAKFSVRILYGSTKSVLKIRTASCIFVQWWHHMIDGSAKGPGRSGKWNPFYRPFQTTNVPSLVLVWRSSKLRDLHSWAVFVNACLVASRLVQCYSGQEVSHSGMNLNAVFCDRSGTLTYFLASGPGDTDHAQSPTSGLEQQTSVSVHFTCKLVQHVNWHML